MAAVANTLQFNSGNTTKLDTAVSFGNKETLIIEETVMKNNVPEMTSKDTAASETKETATSTGVSSSSVSPKVEPTVTHKSGAITVLVTDANHTASKIGSAPLRRQPSTESRDNPFIPDGELSKETDELLKRATIVRDRFYLDQQERKAKGLDSPDNVNAEKSPVREGVVSPVAAQATHAPAKSSQPACAEVKPRMRENGKVEDSVSPEGIKADIDKGAAEPAVDGSKAPADSPADNGKERKKQKKCCSIM